MHAAVSAGIFLFIALLFHFVGQGERDRLEQVARNRAVGHAAEFASRLEGAINSNIYLASGLAAYVGTQDKLSSDGIYHAMQALARIGSHIRNIGVAPGNRLAYVYPPQGNEAAIGLYYPDVPDQWPDVKKAIETKSTILAGPLKLAQGGTGLVGRTPVFLDDGSYWGILSIVLDADGLFKEAGLYEDRGNFRVAVRHHDAGEAPGTPFVGDAAVFADDPVTIDLPVPGGKWQLALAPAEGWSVDNTAANITEIVVDFLAAAFALFAFHFQGNRDKLREHEQEISTILNTSGESIVVVDADDRILEANPAACDLFARTREDLRRMSLDQLLEFRDDKDTQPDIGIDRDSIIGAEDRFVALARSTAKGRIPIEITVGQTEIGGRFVMVLVMRDISRYLDYENQLIELATVDSLTRALNRPAFLAAAERTILLARRHARRIALLVVDADYFKLINDAYGHPVGDLALAALGATLRKGIRESDLFGRLGGEEFAILLPETDVYEAAVVAEKLLDDVRSIEVSVPDGNTVTLTISIGIASLGGDVTSLAELLQAADKALYRAKRNGRNRCEVARTTPATDSRRA